MTAQLEFMRRLCADLGSPREIEQEPVGYDCPFHHVPIIEHHLETIGGWQAVLVCPSFDGTCRYDPDAAPMQIEPPEKPAEKPTASTPANTGGF